MRYRLTLCWQGTAYCGWQVQPGVATVCGTVQDAVEAVLRERGSLTGCSRTDSGVHALGFVAALRCGCRMEPAALQRALNANPPRDIAVIGCEEAPEGFHPRADAAGLQGVCQPVAVVVELGIGPAFARNGVDHRGLVREAAHIAKKAIHPGKAPLKDGLKPGFIISVVHVLLLILSHDLAGILPAEAHGVGRGHADVRPLRRAS